MRFKSLVLLLILGAGWMPASAQQASPTTQPRIRAITAFIRMDRQNYRQQVTQALTMLRQAKADFTKAGYEVETVRITTQPFPEIVKGLDPQQAIAFFREYDQLSQQESFAPDIGPAISKDNDDPARAELLGEIIANTRNVNAFIVVADDAGIHWNSLRAAARVVKYLEDHTINSEGNFRFAAAAFPPSIAPFFPVSYTSGAGREFAIGMESASVVQGLFARGKHDMAEASDLIAAALGKEAQKVEAIAQRIAVQSGWTYQGIDLTPVPLKDISIAGAMESLVGNQIGTPGSVSAAFAITSAIKKINVKQAGYSGLMLPVLEDAVLARRWESGAVTRDALMSYSSVCTTGLDTIPLPGDTSQQELENIISDIASLAVKWHKPLSTRLLPVAGKKAGDMTEFNNPFLVNIRIR